MRLFLLSILAVGSVHSLTIGYPYRSALLAYSPGRGEFPVQSTEVQGYLRYFDNNGVEHLVSYSHPEPTLGVRQVAGIGGSVVRAYNIDVATYAKAIEGHFRAWITVQYKALRAEIEALRAQGKEPSADILSRLQPLEKIFQTADFSTISELPEVKRLFDEHSRIYKVRTELLQQPAGASKTYTTSTYVPQAPLGETPEQKQAREEQLRIYNEQIARLRQLDAQRIETIKGAFAQSQTGQVKIEEQQPLNRLVAQTDGITEVERATQEHLRLWNEAKLRTLDSVRDNQFRTWIYNQYRASSDAIAALKSQGKEASAEMLARFQALGKMYQSTDLSTIADFPEVKRLGAEFSRFYEEKPNFALKIDASSTYVPQLPASETPEQKKAREEHFRIYNEQFEHLRQLETKREEAVQGASEYKIGHLKKAEYQSATDGITEVERATQEHLRLWNEARTRTESAISLQQFRIYVIEQYKILRDEIDALRALSKEPTGDMLTRLSILERIYLTTDYDTIAELPEVKRLFDEFRRINNNKPDLLKHATGEIKTYATGNNVPLLVPNEKIQLKKSDSEKSKFEEQQPINRLSGKADGITEVERATQEHLRLWNEAKLKAEKPNYQQEGIEKESAFKTYEPTINKVTNFAAVQPVQEPEEIKKARAEHLRLVNEATLRVQNANAHEKVSHIEGFIPHLKTAIPQAQQQVQQQNVVDTPEVVRAREEHLRLVNEARLRAQSVEQEESKHKNFITQPVLTANIQHSQPIPGAPKVNQPDPSAYTPEVIKAREEHLRLVNEAHKNVQSNEQGHDYPSGQSQIVETPEVTKAREEHLRIFNEIKSHAEKEQAKVSEIKSSGTVLRSHQYSEDVEKDQEQKRLNEEARILELERLREVERLQVEQKQFEMEQLREAERLAEEQRQMEADLMRIRLEEEQRLELEKLIESRRLQAEQEQAQQIIVTEEYRPIEDSVQDTLSFNGRFGGSSRSEGLTMQQQIIQQTLAAQQPIQQQMYKDNPFLNGGFNSESQISQQQLLQGSSPLTHPQTQQQQQQEQKQKLKPTVAAIVFPLDERKIDTSQNSYGTKQQHIKDDFIKRQPIDHASFQPADTAAVLIHLEKARQEHFRAHDQVLEQLRLARVQSSSLKDCN